MSEIYRIVLGAPRPGEFPEPARWSTVKQTIDPTPNAVTAFDFLRSNPQTLGPRRYVEIDIFVPSPSGDPKVTGVTGSANVVILVPKWPVPCEAALQVELGHNLDSWRALMGYTPYVLANGSDNSARKMRIRYDASGVVTISGDLPELKYDLLELSAEGDDQQLNIVVIPEVNQVDRSKEGSIAEIRIGDDRPITVKG